MKNQNSPTADKKTFPLRKGFPFQDPDITNKYRDIIENIQEGIFEVDLEGHFTFLNHSVCRALGMTKEELMGMNSRQFTDKKDTRKVIEAFKIVYKTGRPFKELGWYITRKNGERRYIEGSIYLRKNDSGEPVGYRVMAYDFTQRKKIEDMLRNSEAQYRLLANHMKDQIWLMDLKLKWKYVSPSVEKLLGYSLEELTHLPLNRLLTSESYKTAMNVYKTEINKSKIASPPPSLKHLLELECRCKDGKILWVESTLSFIHDEEGNIISILGEGRDITDRKRIEETLRLSEEKYRTIFENIDDGYFEVDLAGNAMFFTDAVCRIHGCSREELLGINYRRYTDDENTKKLSQAFNKVYKTGNPLKTLDWQIIRKDGTRRFIESSVFLLKDSSGRAKGFRAIVRDVTDRINAEQQREAALKALGKSEKYFKEITENSSDILIITDKNGEIKYCSRSVERFTGFKPEEVTGRSVFNFVNPDEIKRALDSFSRALLKDDTIIMHNAFRIFHKDGSEIYLDGIGRNLLNNPDIAGFVMNIRDITERKQAEEKLREEQQRFKALADQSSEVIVLVNSEGRITYQNPAIEKALGFKPEERIGFSCFDLVHPHDLNLVTNVFDTLFRDHHAPTQKAEIRLRHKDGSWRMFDAVASNLKNNHMIEFVIVNLHDITERKKNEHALQESRQKYRDLSMIDDLTKLYNSRHFYAQLKKEIYRSNRYGNALTLLLLDLDKFKDFNDKYGHVEGDYVLSQLGKLIKRCLRSTDSAYRYGGEEFTIILPMTTCEEGLLIAKRIQAELAKENFSNVADRKVTMTVSIGLSQFNAKEEIKQFVHRVDQLMYKVKRSERGRICSDDGILH